MEGPDSAVTVHEEAREVLEAVEDAGEVLEEFREMLESSEITYEEPRDDVREELEVRDDVEQQRGRKRKREPDKWQRNQRKCLRNAGLSYINSKKKSVVAWAVRAKDCTTCRYKCNAKVGEPERQDIFKHFWEMGDKNRQRDFIIHHIATQEKKRGKKQGSRRQNTLIYNLTVHGTKVRVCKDFFIKTLDISEKMARSSLSNTSGDGICESSKGGNQTPKNKISDADKDKVREHIKSFQTIESHYCRKDTTKAYLEGTLNLTKMYELYTLKCIEWITTPVKESMYRKIFTSEFNIAFHIPKKDACRQCETFQNLPEHEKALQITEYMARKSRKEQSREHKNKDKDTAQTTPSLKAITFDLEQVLTTPWSNVSSLYYSRKLSTYNLTVYELDTRDAHCFMWHEGEGGRGSSEISTCVYNYLHSLSPEVNHVIMYSDTCGGQN